MWHDKWRNKSDKDSLHPDFWPLSCTNKWLWYPSCSKPSTSKWNRIANEREATNHKTGLNRIRNQAASNQWGRRWANIVADCRRHGHTGDSKGSVTKSTASATTDGAKDHWNEDDSPSLNAVARFQINSDKQKSLMRKMRKNWNHNIMSHYLLSRRFFRLRESFSWSILVLLDCNGASVSAVVKWSPSNPIYYIILRWSSYSSTLSRSRLSRTSCGSLLDEQCSSRHQEHRHYDGVNCFSFSVGFYHVSIHT